MPRKVIIDTDPAMGTMGGDPEDGFALLLALNSPELEVVGITAVQGNVPVERGYSNAAYLIESLDMRVPVYAGPAGAFTAERSKRRKALSRREGMEQLAPLRDPAEQTTSAAAFIKRTCLDNPGAVERVAIGPLTNVALALQSEPSLAGAIPSITVMGGTARIRGNVTPVAEFNIWADPEAAAIVFQAGVPVRMIPLDVCHQTSMGRDELARIGENPHPFCQFVQAAVEPWIEARLRTSRDGPFRLYDSLAVAAAVRSDIVRCRPAFVVIETRGEYTTGATVCEFNESIMGVLRQPKPNADVALEVDVEAFQDLFNERVIEFLRDLPPHAR